MMYVQSPGSCHVKYCTFRHATVIFQHLSASIIENCEFSQTDTAAITVEGYPKEERNWAYNSLKDKIAQYCNLKNFNKQKKELAPTSAYSASTAGQKTLEKSYTFSTDHGDFEQRRKSICSSGKFSSMVTTEDQVNCGQSSNGSVHFESVINSDVLDHLPIPTSVLCDLPSVNAMTPCLLPKVENFNNSVKSEEQNKNGQDGKYDTNQNNHIDEHNSSTQEILNKGDNSHINNNSNASQTGLQSLEDSNVDNDQLDASQSCANYVMENSLPQPADVDSASHHSDLSERSRRSQVTASSGSLYREDSDEFDSGSVNSVNSNPHPGI